MDETTKVLELSGREVVFLTDSINNDDVACSLPDAHKHLAYDLLLKLGSAYCEVMFIDGVRDVVVPIAFTEAEGWLLRAKVKSFDVDSLNVNIGIGLLKKLYPFILSFHTVELNFFDAPAVDEEVKARYAKWRQEGI